MNDQYLKGKVAMVTGAAQGIGAAIARELARRGATMVVTDLQEEKLAATAESLRELGVQVLDIRADATSVAEIRQTFAKTNDELGRLDMLVNNAGLNLSTPFPDIPEDDYDRVMAIHARGPFFSMQEAAKRMADGGRIVNIASAVGIDGRTTFPPYAAGKAALINMTKTISRILGERRITVNAIAPGLIDTDIHKVADQKIGVERMGLKPGELLAKRAEEIPLGYIGKPEDVAGAVDYLCSPAGAYVTGETIIVAGGWTID
ncbi:MAG TPA: SDR family oxidoreductase [Rhodospirillales bacterium]|nr:SDR family oxidoreductase [Rhodospirillales bacterium]